MLAEGLQRGMSTAETMVGETSVTQRLLGTAAARAGDVALLGGPADIPGSGAGLSYPDLAITLQRAAAGLAWRARCRPRWRPACRSPRSPASWPTAGRGC
jgi:cobalamin biosynthesis protein CobD/CbiB